MLNIKKTLVISSIAIGIAVSFYVFARPLPSGTWSQSCRDGKMDGEWLSARCKRSNGDWLDSSIDMKKCESNIVCNREGVLTCGDC
jgi:hypothetical protein